MKYKASDWVVGNIVPVATDTYFTSVIKRSDSVYRVKSVNKDSVVLEIINTEIPLHDLIVNTITGREEYCFIARRAFPTEEIFEKVMDFETKYEEVKYKLQNITYLTEQQIIDIHKILIK